MAVTDLQEGGTLEELAHAARPGRDLVQALHGLQGRADGRRRDALPHDGGRIADRRARAWCTPRTETRSTSSSSRRSKPATPTRSTTRSRARRRPRARRRTARSSWPHLAGARSTWSTSPAARRSSRSRSRARRAGTSGARPAPSTSSTPSTTFSKPDFEGAKYVYSPPRRATRRTGTCSGTRCGPTCSRRSRPTTARSSGTARRRSAGTTSRRSRTAGPASRTGCR